MFIGPASLVLAPTDLSAFLGCRHRTGLDLAVAHGALAPPEWSDPLGQALAERGLAHEREYVAWLRREGLRVVDLAGRTDAEARTREALGQGVDVVCQGVLAHGGWRGHADSLRRVEAPSRLGAWSYQVFDT
jgi:uncharacterized protein